MNGARRGEAIVVSKRMHRRAITLETLKFLAVVIAVAATDCSADSTPRLGQDAAGTEGVDDSAVAADGSAMDAPGADAPAPGDEPDVVISPGTEAGSVDAGSCLRSPATLGHCNSLGTAGSPVSVVCMSGQTLPRPSGGGPVHDGQYVLTSSTFYGPCPAPETDRITWLICGNSWQTVQESTLSAMTTNTFLNAFVSTSGSQANINLNCGQMLMTTFGYDATPTTLTLYQPSGGDASIGRVDKFTRQ